MEATPYHLDAIKNVNSSADLPDHLKLSNNL